jgi:anti-sigma-K factor RskA
MDKDRFLSSGLLEQFVLGLTTPEETREVKRHLEAFPELKPEVEAMRKALEQYAMQQSVPPPPHMKSKILSESNEPDEEKSKIDRTTNRGGARTAGWMLTLAILSALALGFLSTMLYQQKRQYIKAYREIRAEYALFRENCEEEEKELKEAQALYAFLRHTNTRPVELTGTDHSPSARAIVYWNEMTKGAYLNPVHMPAPPPGKQYQVWANVDGEMIHIGLIPKDAGHGLYAVNYIEDAESLNITLEPEGGSDKPTVDQLFVHGKV